MISRTMRAAAFASSLAYVPVVTVPVLLVAGCATTATPSQLANDGAAIVTGLQSVATALSAAGLPSATLTTVQNYLAQAQTAAQSVAAATSTDAMPTDVQTVVALIGQVADAVLPLVPGGGGIALLVQAAVALTPEMLALAGVSGAAVATVHPTMTAAQARAILTAGV